MIFDKAFIEWWDAQTAYEPQEKLRMQDVWLASAKAERERVLRLLEAHNAYYERTRRRSGCRAEEDGIRIEEVSIVSQWIKRGAPDEPGFEGGA